MDSFISLTELLRKNSVPVKVLNLFSPELLNQGDYRNLDDFHTISSMPSPRMFKGAPKIDAGFEILCFKRAHNVKEYRAKPCYNTNNEYESDYNYQNKDKLEVVTNGQESSIMENSYWDDTLSLKSINNTEIISESLEEEQPYILHESASSKSTDSLDHYKFCDFSQNISDPTEILSEVDLNSEPNTY